MTVGKVATFSGFFYRQKNIIKNMRHIRILFTTLFMLVFFSNHICAQDYPLKHAMTAEKETGIDAWILLAIAKVESNFSQYAVNVEGKPFYFTNIDDAVRQIEKAKESGKSYDIGYMQINSYWFNKYNIPARAGFDADINFTLGALILKYEIVNNGVSWETIGLYHSKNPILAKKYSEKIKKHAKYFKEFVEISKRKEMSDYFFVDGLSARR